MISWFGEFGYHSRVILDIIYAFIYMKSLYDFTISLNHIWYHSYETRYDFMMMISLYDVKAMISYIDFIISLNHDMKSYLKACIEIIVMKSSVDEIIQWFHGSEFMTMISCLISCYEINSKNHEIVYMKHIFGRALSRFRCGFGRSRVAFHYDCTMNSNCAQPGSGWLDAEQERRPAAEPAAEQCAACAPPCCWAMSHPAPGRVPAALQCATDCWAGAAAMVHARMVLFQRFSWGCCAGPPLESYEVVDDDVERAILRLSWDGCHCDVTPSLWVTWGRRMHAAAEAAHDSVLDLCPLVSWLSTFCRRLAWKSPANKENDKQRNNNWSLMQHANRSRCVIQQARHHRWSRMDDWAAMLDFPAEIQSNKLNFAFTIGNFTKLPLSHHKKQLEELTRTKLAWSKSAVQSNLARNKS